MSGGECRTGSKLALNLLPAAEGPGSEKHIGHSVQGAGRQRVTPLPPTTQTKKAMKIELDIDGIRRVLRGTPEGFAAALDKAVRTNEEFWQKVVLPVSGAYQAERMMAYHAAALRRAEEDTDA